MKTHTERGLFNGGTLSPRHTDDGGKANSEGKKSRPSREGGENREERFFQRRKEFWG